MNDEKLFCAVCTNWIRAEFTLARGWFVFPRAARTRVDRLRRVPQPTPAVLCPNCVRDVLAGALRRAI